MEEEETNIIKVIATIEEDKKKYSIDIDDSNTFYEFKKILSAAAHLFKNNFRIYHKDQEYTNEYNDNTLRELFPQLQICDLIIKKNSDLDENEKDFLSVKLLMLHVKTIIQNLKFYIALLAKKAYVLNATQNLMSI